MDGGALLSGKNHLNPNFIPRNLEEVSQSWLERVLHDGSQMPAFDLQPIDANNSSTARLVFADEPPTSRVPRTCILKICPAGHDFLGASEVNYYNRDYLGLPEAPIPKCYHAVWAKIATSQSVGEGYALFLEDLGVDYADHKLIEPNDTHAGELGRALGQLHAHRWGVRGDPEGLHDLKSDFAGFLSHVSKGLDPILGELADTLDPSSQARLIEIFDTDADRMLQRALAGNGLALVHRDPNPTNVLTSLSRQKGHPPLFLVDRQPFHWSLRLWLGASDLVYAVVPFWPEERRRALQKTLLLSYHSELLKHGVLDYTLQDLQEDWRSCACMALFTAIEWGSDPSSLKEMRWLWEVQLQRALIFIEDCDTGAKLF